MKKSFILFFMMAFVWSGFVLAQNNMTHEQKLAYDQNTEVLQPGPVGNPVDLPSSGNKALLLNEDFATQIPADWTTVVYSGTGVWEWNAGGYAQANSDAHPSDVFDVGLFTSSVDFSGEIMGAVTFTRNLQDYAGDGAGELRVYSGGTSAGNLETVLWSQTTDDVGAPVTETYTFDPSSFADPSDVYFEFWYSTEGGTWAWYFKLYSVTVESVQPKIEITPTALDLGEWPIGGWQQYDYLTLENTGAGTAAVNGSELDDPDGVFDLMNPALPVTLPANGTQMVVYVGFDGAAATDGQVYNATYVASWGAGKGVTTASVTATAYAAPIGDIAENPWMVTVPYSNAGVSTALPMRSNYIIPGTATNGKDVVYKFSLAEDKELSVALTNATETPKMAIYPSDFGGEGGPSFTNALVSGGADITNTPLYAGDYFLVVSAEADDAAMTFDIDITATTMPDPEKAFNPSPADGAIDIPSNGLVLGWEFGQYTNEYKLSFGTTYPPSDVLVDWTSDLATSYALPNLDPSMQYFWRVDVKNNNGMVEGDTWGFTTTLTPPSNLTASVVEIAEDEYNVVLNWTASAKALLSYNVYRDGAMIGTTTVGTTTYTDLDLAYNMNPCYEYSVEAVFDEGVSAMSNTASACITGVGTVDGHVTELLTGNPINGATVTLTGARTYTFTTDFTGAYSGEVLEGNYDYTVDADGYISGADAGVTVAYGATTTDDFQLDEFPFPVNSVVAVATEDDQAVDVYWNSPGVSGGGNVIDEDFTGGMPSWFVGDAPEADWHVDNNMLTLTTGGANVWRSGYKNDVYTDFIYQVSQQRNGGSDGGSMGIYVRGNGFADMTPGNGANGNMFCWTTNGYWWYGTLTDGDLPDWSGWATTGAISQGLGVANIISAEVIGSTATFFINGTEITSAATIETEGFVGGFAHEGTVASEMAFDYWQIIPGGMGKNATVSNEVQYEGKGSITECLSAPKATSNTAVKGLAYDTRPLANDKELSGYMVYRQVCDESTPMEFLGMTLDTTFRDNTWGIADWGMYKWAVEAVYNNNNSAPEYSNCLDKDMIAAVSVEVTTNSGDSPEGTYVLFTNTSEPDLELFYETTLDATGMFAWDSFRKGTYDIMVHLNGFADIALTGVAIEQDEDFVWQLEELIAPPTDLYVTPTGFATWGGGGAIPYAGFAESFDTQEQFDMWEVVDGGSSNDTWHYTSAYNGNTLDGTPFAFCNADAGGPGISMDEMLISPVIDASMVSELYLDFDLVHQVIGDHMDIDVYDGTDWVTIDVSNTDTGAYPWGPTVHKNYDVTAYANAEFRVRFHYVAGWDWYVAVDNVVVTDENGKYAGANKEFQLYKVWHDGVFSADVDTNFYQYGQSGEVLVPGETYLAEVAALYSTGLSDKAQYEWTYLPCDSFPSYLTYDAYNINGSNDNLVVWTDNIFFTPINEDFENGLPEGWTATTNSSVGWFFTADGSSTYWTVPPGNGQYACSNDDAANDDGSMDYLITPEMDFTGLDAISLSFNSFFTGDYGQTAAVEVSTDGSNWTVVADVTAGSAWTMVDVDLSAYANESSVWVAFHSNDNGSWASGWAVDDVAIAPSKAGKANSVVLGANVYRDGEMIAFVADPDTFYLDSNLDPGYYDYCIAKVYSEDDGMHTWTSCLDATCVEDVLVPEDCLAPENLTAEDLLGDGYTATLNWSAPNGFDPMWLQYDDGVNVDAIGGPTEFSVAAKWDPSQLVDFDGTAITKVKFFPRDASTSGSITLKIWKGANAGTLLYEQPLSGLTFDDWNEITLDTPVDIDITEELWVGYYIVTTGYNAGCGNFTGNPNSDYVSLDGTTWEHLGDYGLSYSWNLGAYVEAAKGAYVALPGIVDNATYSDNKATFAAGNLPASPNAVDPTAGVTELMGYNVYRDGEQVNTDLVTETTYADVTGVAGYFCYKVTAVYSVCGESDFSNEACVDVAAGVSDVENNVSVYPNPATDFVMVEANSNIRSIEITNYMGQVVSSLKEVETTQTRIETSSLSAGVYFVEVETEAGIEKVRIVISE
jgi:hypothetical protein